MKFSVGVSDQPAETVFDEKCLYGFITIGDFTERFAMPVEFWPSEKYELQWREALRSIVNGAERACLVTEMRDPRIGMFISLFTMYGGSETVYIQNQIVLCDGNEEAILAERFDSFIDDRETESDGQPISEWPIPLSDLKEASCGMI